MDFDTATGTMVGDGNGNKLVVGKAKPELLNRFGFLLPPNEVSTYLRDSYQSSYWKDKDVLFIRTSNWMVVFVGNRSTPYKGPKTGRQSQ
jgi:hypothetical protein